MVVYILCLSFFNDSCVIVHLLQFKVKKKKKTRKLFGIVSNPFVYVLYNKICSIHLKTMRNKSIMVK